MIKIKIISILVFLLVLSSCHYEKLLSSNKDRTPSSLGINRNLYDISKSCFKNKNWLEDAINQTKLIRKILTRMYNDANCSSVINAIRSANRGSDFPNPLINDQFSFPPNISVPQVPSIIPGDNFDIATNIPVESQGENPTTLIRELSNSGFNNDIFTLLLASSIDNSINNQAYGDYSAYLSKVANDTYIKTVNLVSTIMQALPANQLCLHNDISTPSEILAVTTSLLTSMVSGSSSNISYINRITESFAGYIRNKKYAKAFQSLDAIRFSISLSCLIENTTENYCKVKDAYQIINSSNRKDLYTERKFTDEHNYLEGYHIVEFQMPVITDWIIKILKATNPRYKEKSEDPFPFPPFPFPTDNESDDPFPPIDPFFNGTNIIGDSFTDNTSILGNPFSTTSQLNPVGPNSFNPTTNVEFPSPIPNIPTGAEPIPIPVPPPTPDNPFPTSPTPYPYPYPQSPEINSDINSNKFTDPDYHELVASISTGDITAKQSLINIKDYLNKLFNRFNKENSNVEVEIIGLLSDTIKRISNILDSLQELELLIKSKKELLQSQNKSNLEKALVRHGLKKETPINDMLIKIYANDFKLIYKKIINTVNNEFKLNNHFQTFFINRIALLVKYDFQHMMKQNVNLEEYKEEIERLSREQIENNIIALNKNDNVNDMLYSAQITNQLNIKSLEDMFSNYYLKLIRELDAVEKGNTDDLHSFNWDTMKMFLKDTKALGLYRPLYNLLTNSDKYPIKLKTGGVISLTEDEFGSIKMFKSKLCIQSMAFKNIKSFYSYCKDSVVYPYSDRIDFYGRNLSAQYNRYILEYNNALKSKNNNKIQGITDNMICAYRNYRKRNEAHNLVKRLKSNEGL